MNWFGKTEVIGDLDLSSIGKVTVAEALGMDQGENVGEEVATVNMTNSFRIYPGEKAEKWDSSWREKNIIKGKFRVFIKTRDNRVF